MTSTIPAAVLAAERDFGDALALAEPGGPRLTFRQLADRVATVSRAFIASGIEPGDRVAIWSPNTHHWVLAALGALSAGATLVPVNTRFTGPEALDVIGRSDAKVLLVAGPFLRADRLAMLRAAAAAGVDGRGRTGPASAGGQSADTGLGGQPARLPGLIVRIPVEPDTSPVQEDAAGAVSWAEFGASAAQVPPAVAVARAAAVRPDDVSDILFTSGTTGRSKGAMSAHRQAIDVARAWAQCAGLTSADRYLIANPFFHSFGYKAGVLACLLTGATIVPQLAFDAGHAMALIDAEQITVFPGAPTIYQSMLDHPDRPARSLASLRLAVTGAAVVPVALVERMRAELTFDTVLTAYGLTEAVVATMCQPGDAPHTVAQTSGRPVAGFEVKILGKNAQPAGPGETGEILLRGRNVMLGYLDDPAATAQAVDAGGWLHTGDVGYLNDRGYLTITDRITDMYICGGFNVYPAEVEQALARHPGVAESAVIGVPDGRLGEVGRAYVMSRPGQQPDADDLIAFCRARLANYKVPRQVVFRDTLPRNPAGKPLKRLLRQESMHE